MSEYDDDRDWYETKESIMSGLTPQEAEELALEFRDIEGDDNDNDKDDFSEVK